MHPFEKVPVVGQGTWSMEKDHRESVRALIRGLELGLTHIDTAEMYGDGRAEEIVGEAIADRRGDVFLVSKVLPKNASYARTIKACEASLRRMKTDHLDVYLLHWRDDQPLEETFKAFERLIDEGKIRAWGVSNFDVADLEEALSIAGPGKIACNQVLYNVLERTIEHAVLPWCATNQIPVVAYSPYGSRGGFNPTAGQQRVLAEIALARGCTSRAIALRFLVERGAWTIPKASRFAHVEENARALQIALSAEEMTKIDAAFPLGAAGALPML